ncbi:hypothetical protein NLG97_g9438 [Lecanicillium saksenae]|uniref:Uncharacterized protein n=1 Tax=Lecanicillium saksenae TaxID=468837 RepID=A0ACC1QG11_9HYPO|nr:hypothetical protein NLG97_g9438 [Lecanicillium saksenae]
MARIRSALWKTTIVQLATAFALLAGLVEGDNCEQTNFRVSSQEDATALSKCSIVKGDVIIASTAKGSISLDGVEEISGSLSNEKCFDGANDDDKTKSLLDGNLRAWEGCSDLDSFSSNTLTLVRGDFALRSLVRITEVDLKNLKVRMNLSSLGTVESLFVRHNRQLVNLTMSQLNNITAENSTIELVDLGIYKWPRIKVRIHHYEEESPRRLERLVAKDLPNIPLFEFNNADEIGHMEAHGLQNQTAQLTTEYKPTGPVFGDPFTDPVASIDKLIMKGFGGKFLIDSRYDRTIKIKHVEFDNTNMTNINLWHVAEPQPLFITNNPNLDWFSMPANMTDVQWRNIEFINNPKLSFGEDRVGHPKVGVWYWGFSTSTLIIRHCQMIAEWIGPRADGITRITERLEIAPSGNVTEVCGYVLKRAQKGEIVFPNVGYTCGNQTCDPRVNGVGKLAPRSLFVILVIGGLAKQQRAPKDKLYPATVKK